MGKFSGGEGGEWGFKSALNYSFLLLKYRGRSKSEIAHRLTKQKVSPQIIEKVLNYLQECGLIDDRSFTFSFIREKIRRGFGIKRIVFDLKKLGVEEELINEGIEKVKKEVDYKGRLRELIVQRRKRYGNKEEGEKRVMRYLLSRGFGYEEILEVWNEV
ncbi:MAG: hypothetical protein B6D55_03000 [Candidatus Omnitrophica bacterium 4484_70.2]|nr:MAG: hypothetical protein B6D55_03000 [Candidatus Omnitrophica bacterium 4484_70.2]